MSLHVFTRTLGGKLHKCQVKNARFYCGECGRGVVQPVKGVRCKVCKSGEVVGVFECSRGVALQLVSPLQQKMAAVAVLEVRK